MAARSRKEGEKFCESCGAIIKKEAVICPKCGVQVGSFKRNVGGASEKSRLAALLLLVFLGAFGVHRFYVGRIGTGLLYLLTFGLLGIGVIIDLITILTGSFKDNEGKRLVYWVTNQ